jgi:hypothetical protein
MARPKKRHERPTGQRRFLKIFASDPMLGKTSGNRMIVDIVNEPLEPGPAGSRIKVVDYDGARDRYYEPVDLDHPDVLHNRGLEPSESDPKFHQQMVYAVAMKVIENFERALGRTFHFWGRQPLRLLPHAFSGPNAYYQRQQRAVLFGYFRADEQDPGPNLPGQTVFNCLSHDVIAHEVSHAILDRLKPFLLEPSNLDAQAFHEGFADLVALFQHFVFRDFVHEAIQQTRTDLREPTLLVKLAQQFGYASGMGRELRSALGRPDRRLYASVWECHERGSILVAAVFDAFFKVYQRRIQDLLRIATGGTGVLPQGHMHPDLVNRVAAEANATAQSMLTMCIRALDYLPPVAVTFGDYLRSLLTADQELVAVDTLDQRGALIEAFRLRGIYPDGVVSLAEESVVWERASAKFPRVPILPEKLAELVNPSDSLGPPPLGTGATQAAAGTLTPQNQDTRQQAVALHAYAQQNPSALLLEPPSNFPIQVNAFHFLFRTEQDGSPRFEFVVQFVQTDRERQAELGGIPFRGGTTLIADPDGRVKYVIAKPLGSRPAARRRLEAQKEFTHGCALRDPLFSWHRNVQQYERNHMVARMNLAHVHGGVYR